MACFFSAPVSYLPPPNLMCPMTNALAPLPSSTSSDSLWNWLGPSPPLTLHLL